MKTLSEQQTAHTPGPWTVTTLRDKHSIWGKDSVICQTQTSCPEIDNRVGAPTCPETAEANAQLIAAAPEMLKALKGCAAALKEAGKDFAQANKLAARPNLYELHAIEADKAIAKAERAK